VPTLNKIYLLTNRIGGVMVGVLALSTVDRGIEPHSGQTRDYKIGICCFTAKQVSWRQQVDFQSDDDEVRFVLAQHT
jgi:hypothetical protein